MVPSRLICSYFCYGILFKNVVWTVLISVCPQLCRHLVALGLIRRKSPSYLLTFVSSSARRLSHQEQKRPSFEERLCRGMRLSHCSLSSGSLSGCSGTSVIIADIVATAVIIAINPFGQRGEGQVEWRARLRRIRLATS